MIFLDRRKILAAASVLGLIVIVGWVWRSASTFTGGREAALLKIGLMGKVSNIDPALINSGQEKLVASTIFEPLVGFDDRRGSLKPCLARNWGYSQDGKRLVFFLSPEARFHGGRRLTAEDVKASWERSLRLADGWNKIHLFEGISGVNAFRSGKTSQVSGIKALDSHTLEVSFDKPDSSFIYKVTNPVFWVVDTRDVKSIPQGTGPFLLHEFQPPEKIGVRRFSRYHGVLPKLSGIEFRCYGEWDEAFEAYKKGELNIINNVPFDEYRKLKEDLPSKASLTKTSLFSIYALGMNVYRYPFSEPEFRLALNYGVDRDILVEGVCGGVGRSTKGILPLGLPGYNKSLKGFAYDPEKAKEMLSESTYFMQKNPPTLKLIYNQGSGHERMMKGVEVQLEAMGIKVVSSPKPWDTYLNDLSNLKPDFFRFGWEADYSDPDSFLYYLFHSRQIGTSNLTGYHNRQVDSLLDEARKETKDKQRRFELLRKAEQIIVDDAPCVNLLQKETVTLVGADIEGFCMDGMYMVDWRSLAWKDPRHP